MFDREAYSPELFAEMQAKRIAVVTYHKYPGEDWPAEEFSERTVEVGGGDVVGMKLAERGTRLSNGLWARQVRKLSAGGKQTAILSTDYEADYTRLAASMFARWSQENFFKYMREHYGLDRLVEYGTGAVPDSVRVVNLGLAPAGQPSPRPDRQAPIPVGSVCGPEFARRAVGSGSDRLPTEKSSVTGGNRASGEQLGQIKQQRKQTVHHVTVGELPEAERFSRLLPERKHFLDTIKLISYRAETSMASLLRESLSREDDTRALLRQIYSTEADLLPDADHKTLTVRLHHLTQAAHD